MDHPHFAFWHQLRQSRLLPTQWTVDSKFLVTGVNLVPLLRDAWEQQCRASLAPLVQQFQQRLIGVRPQPFSITRGLPAPAGDRVRRWIGERLVWWPAGIPVRRWVGIVSSRLPRPLHEQCHWFAGLRGACEIARADGETLVFASQTTTARFLERCGSLYQFPTLRLDLARENQPFDRWLTRCLEKTPWPDGNEWQRVAYVSPPIGPDPDCASPIRDALIVAASDRLVALRVRDRGNIGQLLTRRLGEASSPAACVELTLGKGLVSMSTASQLRDLGARSVAIVAKPSVSAPAILLPVPPGVVQNVALLRADQIPTDQLLHWTRQQPGPWPDESDEEYLDALILQQPAANHSALESLRRIAAQQCLWATSSTIRGGTPVVCFTSTPVLELIQKRQFRPHRGRWDFEMFGISIDRQWLTAIGTRPVLYGDETLWHELPENDKPFFQQQTTRGPGSIDWTAEREWRHVGPVDLKPLPREAATLFVPRCEDARRLLDVSRWPIAIFEMSLSSPPHPGRHPMGVDRRQSEEDGLSDAR